VVVALDTSRSMLAEDLKPNRMDAAKREVQDLFRLLKGNRLGLVTFAGESITSCPLTLDASAAALFLDGVSVNSVPTPGTNLEKAIRRGAVAFASADKRFKVLVLITDGEGHEGDALVAAKEAAEQGVVIFTIGIGTVDGSTVPLRDPETGVLRENLRDRAGKPVFTRLGRTTLQKVAAATGGAYYESGGGNLELDHLQETIAQMETRELSGHQARKPIERYPLVVGLALAALAVESRSPSGARRRRHGPGDSSGVLLGHRRRERRAGRRPRSRRACPSARRGPMQRPTRSSLRGSSRRRPSAIARRRCGGPRTPCSSRTWPAPWPAPGRWRKAWPPTSRRFASPRAPRQRRACSTTSAMHWP
jgi:Ca-activated chloride channel family protein